MKITPIATPANTIGAVETSAPPTLRSLKMTTNKTPERYEPKEDAAETNQQKMSINDNNKDTSEAVTEGTQPLSPQLAALARQRRALQVKERAILDREKALAEKEAQAPAIDLARLKSDPLGVLLDSGVTYDQLTEAVLAKQNGVPLPEIQALKEELRSLKEGVNKTLTERDVQQKQAALAEIRREATLLSSQGEDYALVRESKSIPKVLELIEKTYDKTGEVLDVREALSLVENELIEDSLRLAKLQKVQSKIAPHAPEVSQLQRPQMKTLTNKDTASVALDRRARALAAFYGNLKK